MDESVIQVIVYVVSIGVLTVVFLAVRAHHMTVSLSTLYQALPAILAVVVAIQRMVSELGSTEATSSAKVEVTRSAVGVEAHVVPLQGASPNGAEVLGKVPEKVEK